MSKRDKLGYASRSSFHVVGKVRINSDSFTDPVPGKNNVNWLSIRNYFYVDTPDGTSVRINIQGGYDTQKNIIYTRQYKEDGSIEPIQLDYNLRNDEEILGSIVASDLKKANIDPESDTEQVFVCPIDYAEYLKEYLKNGEDVVVYGDIEYSEGRDTIYRNYNIRGIYLNQLEKTETGDLKLKYEPSATVTQTYLIDENSLSNYKRELESNGKTIVRTIVPQYLSSTQVNGRWVPLKEVVPLQQAIVVKVAEGKSAEDTAKLVEKLFKVPRDTVREVNIVADIVEGYSTSDATIEIAPEMQELIDLGLMTEDDLKRQVVRGTYTSELVFKNIQAIRDENGITRPFDDEKYSTKALVRPQVQEDSGPTEEILDDLGDFLNF